jgi:preprotein translocase subunit SecA
VANVPTEGLEALKNVVTLEADLLTQNDTLKSELMSDLASLNLSPEDQKQAEADIATYSQKTTEAIKSKHFRLGSQLTLAKTLMQEVLRQTYSTQTSVSAIADQQIQALRSKDSMNTGVLDAVINTPATKEYVSKVQDETKKNTQTIIANATAKVLNGDFQNDEDVSSYVKDQMIQQTAEATTKLSNYFNPLGGKLQSYRSVLELPNTEKLLQDGTIAVVGYKYMNGNPQKVMEGQEPDFYLMDFVEGKNTADSNSIDTFLDAPRFGDFKYPWGERYGTTDRISIIYPPGYPKGLYVVNQVGGTCGLTAETALLSSSPEAQYNGKQILVNQFLLVRLVGLDDQRFQSAMGDVFVKSAVTTHSEVLGIGSMKFGEILDMKVYPESQMSTVVEEKQASTSIPSFVSNSQSSGITEDKAELLKREIKVGGETVTVQYIREVKNGETTYYLRSEADRSTLERMFVLLFVQSLDDLKTPASTTTDGSTYAAAAQNAVIQNQHTLSDEEIKAMVDAFIVYGTNANKKVSTNMETSGVDYAGLYTALVKMHFKENGDGSRSFRSQKAVNNFYHEVYFTAVNNFPNYISSSQYLNTPSKLVGMSADVSNKLEAVKGEKNEELLEIRGKSQQDVIFGLTAGTIGEDVKIDPANPPAGMTAEQVDEYFAKAFVNMYQNAVNNNQSVMMGIHVVPDGGHAINVFGIFRYQKGYLYPVSVDPNTGVMTTGTQAVEKLVNPIGKPVEGEIYVHAYEGNSDYAPIYSWNSYGPYNMIGNPRDNTSLIPVSSMKRLLMNVSSFSYNVENVAPEKYFEAVKTGDAKDANQVTGTMSMEARQQYQSIGLILTPDNMKEYKLTDGTKRVIAFQTVINQYNQDITNGKIQKDPTVFSTYIADGLKKQGVVITPEMQSELTVLQTTYFQKPGQLIQCVGWAEATGGIANPSFPSIGLPIKQAKQIKQYMDPTMLAYVGNRKTENLTFNAGESDARTFDSVENIPAGSIFFEINRGDDGHVGRVLEVIHDADGKVLIVVTQANRFNEGLPVTQVLTEQEFIQMVGSMDNVFFLTERGSDKENAGTSGGNGGGGGGGGGVDVSTNVSNPSTSTNTSTGDTTSENQNTSTSGNDGAGSSTNVSNPSTPNTQSMVGPAVLTLLTTVSAAIEKMTGGRIAIRVPSGAQTVVSAPARFPRTLFQGGAGTDLSISPDAIRNASKPTVDSSEHAKRNAAFISAHADGIAFLGKVAASRAKYTGTSSLVGEANSLRQRLVAGETLDDIMPDAFALFSEGSRRILKKDPFEAQLLAGYYALHGRGNIVELPTGVGKTLTVGLTAFVRSLLPKPSQVHAGTAAEELVSRDATEMLPLYEAFGLKVGYISSQLTGTKTAYSNIHTPGVLRESTMKETYDTVDILYALPQQFVYDYLKSNRAAVGDIDALRNDLHRLSYIGDEIDQAAIDQAITQMVLSSDTPIPANKILVSWADAVAAQLTAEDVDIYEESQQVFLTDSGLKKVKAMVGRDGAETPFDLLDETQAQQSTYFESALRARFYYKKDIHYTKQNGRIIFINSLSRELEYGKRYGNGDHEAIEMKEGVEVQDSSETIDEITLQMFFRKYAFMAGFSGSVESATDEITAVFGKDVTVLPNRWEVEAALHPEKYVLVRIPKQDGLWVYGYALAADETRTPVYQERLDLEDRIFWDSEGMYDAIAQDSAEKKSQGTPTLIGIRNNDELNPLVAAMKRRGLTVNVLTSDTPRNLRQKFIADAGKPGIITVSTSDRGMDITQAQIVQQHDGLYVIAIGKRDARVDTQLRGRTARNGASGFTRLYWSLLDPYDTTMAGTREWVARIVPSGELTGIWKRFGDWFGNQVQRSISLGAEEQRHREYIYNVAGTEQYAKQGRTLGVFAQARAYYDELLTSIRSGSISQVLQSMSLEALRNKAITADVRTRLDAAIRTHTSDEEQVAQRSIARTVLFAQWKQFIEDLNQITLTMSTELMTQQGKDPLTFYITRAMGAYQEFRARVTIETLREIGKRYDVSLDPNMLIMHFHIPNERFAPYDAFPGTLMTAFMSPETRAALPLVASMEDQAVVAINAGADMLEAASCRNQGSSLLVHPVFAYGADSMCQVALLHHPFVRSVLPSIPFDRYMHTLTVLWNRYLYSEKTHGAQQGDTRGTSTMVEKLGKNIWLPIVQRLRKSGIPCP